MKLSCDALRHLRIESKLSQEQMADRMNIQQSKYNRLENGKTAIKYEQVSKIAEAIGKSYEDMLGQLTGCTITTTSNNQKNQNFVYYDVDKNVINEKDVIIETQKQALSALNMTVKVLHNKISELEIKFGLKVT